MLLAYQYKPIFLKNAPRNQKMIEIGTFPKITLQREMDAVIW